MPAATPRFEIIGENIHCTRVVLLNGKKVRREGDVEFIPFTDGDRERRLVIPDWYRDTDTYAQERVKHCIIALREAMSADDPAVRDTGLAYLLHLGARQVAAGAAFLDVNVDEFSPDPDVRRGAMEWLAPRLRDRFEIPLSIDSSNPEILEAGLAACADGPRPMLNSVSLERAETIDIAARYRARIVASAAGADGMPADAAERIANAVAILERAAAAGIATADIYVDPLVFPVGTDPAHGVGFLDAVRGVRDRHGLDLHITGGLSNVSFGMPNRRFLNLVFTRLCIDAGCDSGIVDPVQISIDAVTALDPANEAFGLARAALVGEDPYGMNYLEAYREGRLV